MKILFISPEQGTTGKNATPVPPSAILFIAGLTPRDIDVELIDMTYEKVNYDVDVDLVAFSVMTVMAEATYRVADRFRQKGKKVVIGGHHAASVPLEVKEHADIVVIGEAEYVWKKILEDFKTNNLSDFYVGGNPGTLTVKDLPGKVYVDERIPDLINQPHYRREILKRKYLFDVMFTTRGCPYNCSFCTVTKFFGAKQRHRPIPDVIKELHEVQNLYFLADDNCYFPSSYYKDLYDEIHKNFGAKKKWFSQGSLSVVNERDGDIILEKAVKAGQIAVFIGLESINPESLKSVNAYAKIGHTKNNIDLEFTRKAIQRIQSHGIMVWAFCILGFTTDTKETFNETLKFLDETKVMPMPLLLSPLPGTDLWAEYKDLILPDQSWDKWDGAHSLYQHPQLSVTELEDIFNEFRINLFSTDRMWKRAFFNEIKYMPMNMAIESGMKKSFIDNYNEIKKERLVKQEA